MPDTPLDTPLDVIADELYALRPDAFVPGRDEAVARARETGDKDLARAIGKLRRPTRAAWLANLLARHRAEQLDGLLNLAAELGEAQRTLDGTALRALSAQRSRLVRAMAREAGNLARAEHESVGDGLLRDLQGILEAALGDPEIAAQVRSGRLTRTVTWSGFGPAQGSPPAPARRPLAVVPPPPAPATGSEPDSTQQDPAEHERAAHERAERERAEQAERARAERARRERELAAAEAEEDAARARQRADEAARDDAVAARDRARDRAAALAAELESARDEERAATAAARDAEAAARDSARAAETAATRAARARAHLEG